jgi:glycosidase
VAGEVPTDFWENARVELERIKPDIFLLAEAHKAELLVKAFDADYSWPLHSALTDVLQGRKPASEIRAAWEAETKEWPRNSLHLRFSDNHDERRAIARFGERAALAASALMFTLDGVPLLYNGMEVGDTTESGAPALFEKLPIFWPIAERRPEFPRFYKQIMSLRSKSAPARRGSLKWLQNSDESRVLTYLRRAKNEELLVAINLSSKPFFGLVGAEGVNGYVDITPDVGPPLPPDAPVPEATVKKRHVTLPALSMEAWGYRMFGRQSSVVSGRWSVVVSRQLLYMTTDN